MAFTRRTIRWVIVFYIMIGLFGFRFSIADADEPKIHAFDGFDQDFELEWEPLRSDVLKISLEKNPGKLTIVAQPGTIGGASRPGQILAKNLYLITNPVPGGGDFVITTCIESFRPTMKWQQAGLLIYDDDDNFLKSDMEWSGSAVRFKYMRETEAFKTIDTDTVVPDADRIWIRITKRGNVYERSYSTDGESFESAGEKGWGDGDPTWVGILAKTGPSNAEEIDAAFDFFEVRGLTDVEKDDKHYVERKRFRGQWAVVSSEFAGEPVEQAPLAAFSFDGGFVSYIENEQAMRAEYTLTPNENPKGIKLSNVTRTTNTHANGIYSLEGDTLKICLALKQDAPAPTELTTKEGDSRLLIVLKREPEQDDSDQPADE